MSPDKLLALVIGKSCESRIPHDDDGRLVPREADERAVDAALRSARQPGSTPGDSLPNPHTQEMRCSIIAARVANILHLAACELYGTDQRLFDALRSSEKAILIQLASDVLQDLKPEKCWHCGTWLQHDMDDFCSPQCRIAQERG